MSWGASRPGLLYCSLKEHLGPCIANVLHECGHCFDFFETFFAVSLIEMLLHEVIQSIKVLRELATFVHIQCGLKLCNDCLGTLDIVMNLLVLASKIFLIETQLRSRHEA